MTQKRVSLLNTVGPAEMTVRNPAPKHKATKRQLGTQHHNGVPAAQGLYNPTNEHDACGVGFIANMKSGATHKIIEDGIQILENLEHRGAVGADPLMGDGAGLLSQMPHGLFKEVCDFDLPEPGNYAVGFLFSGIL